MASIKPGVVFWPKMHPVIEHAIEEIDRVHVRTVKRGAIITSARDGTHSENSFHYNGRAIDLRTRDLTETQIVQLSTALRRALGRDFDVVVEPTHIHVEFDRKTETTAPE